MERRIRPTPCSFGHDVVDDGLADVAYAGREYRITPENLDALLASLEGVVVAKEDGDARAALAETVEAFAEPEPGPEE